MAKNKTKTFIACISMPLAIASVGFSFFSVRDIYKNTSDKAVYEQAYQDGVQKGKDSQSDLNKELNTLVSQKVLLLTEISTLTNEIGTIEANITILEEEVAKLQKEQDTNQSLLQQKQELSSNLSTLKNEKQAQLDQIKQLYNEKREDGKVLIIYVAEDRVAHSVVIDYNTTPEAFNVANTTTRRFVGWTNSQGDILHPTSISATQDTTYFAKFAYGYETTFTYEVLNDRGNVEKQTTKNIVFEDKTIITPTIPVLPEEYTKDYIGGWVVAGTRDFVDPSTFEPNKERQFEYIYKMKTWNVTANGSLKRMPTGNRSYFHFSNILPLYRDTLNLKHATSIDLTLTLDVRHFEFNQVKDLLFVDTTTLQLINNNGIFETSFVMHDELFKISITSTDEALVVNIENLQNKNNKPYYVTLSQTLITYEEA